MFQFENKKGCDRVAALNTDVNVDKSNCCYSNITPSLNYFVSRASTTSVELSLQSFNFSSIFETVSFVIKRLYLMVVNDNVAITFKLTLYGTDCQFIFT